MLIQKLFNQIRMDLSQNCVLFLGGKDKEKCINFTILNFGLWILMNNVVKLIKKQEVLMKKIILYIVLSFALFTSADDEKLEEKAFKAIFNGNHESFSIYMTAGLDVHTTDTHGNTFLHIAVMVENPFIVRILLEHKANPHKKNKLGSTPLSLSEDLENTQIIDMLTLDTKQSDSKIKTRELPSILDIQKEKELEESFWQAVEKGSYQEVEALLSIGADKYVNNIRNDEFEEPTPLLRAIKRRYSAGRKPSALQEVNDLIIDIIDIIDISQDRKYEDENVESKRIKEIREADKIIDILMKYADVNLQATNSSYSLPIKSAIYYNLPHVVEKLAQAGANLSLPDDYISSLLKLAIKSSYFEIIAILLKYKAPFTKKLNDYLVEKKNVPHKVMLFVYQHVGNPDYLQDYLQAQAETQTETKPKAPAEAQSETQAEAKPDHLPDKDTQAEAKPKAQDEAKPDHLPNKDTQSEAKPETPTEENEGKKSCPRQFKK